MGIYELVVRTDGKLRINGGKSWWLELQKTGHRHNVQIHRAAPNLYIEGCILPVHFNAFQGSAIQRGDSIIRTKSVQLMDQIQVRLTNFLSSGTTSGRPTLVIAETLPAELLTDRSHAHA